MKKRRAFKLACICLLIGVALGMYWRRGGVCPRSHAATAGEAALYADQAGDFDPSAAPAGAIVVDFRDDLDGATVAALGRSLGIVFRAESPGSAHDGIYLGTLDPAAEALDLDLLRHDARVEAAEEAFVYGLPESALDPRDEGLLDDKSLERGPGFPNDPRAGEQWHMDQIHMPAAWTQSTGEGVIVAVIDTGVAHVEDLAQTEFVPGWNFVSNTADSDDDHGHGTHVAGTIAQSTHNGIGVTGVAYKAKIMPLKVLSASGSGSVAGIAAAVRFAADHGAKVINMSLGGAMNSQVLAKAVAYAHDHGVVVVCAAGNDGRGRVSYPAANPGALAVAATQQDEKTTFYSNWGKQVAIAAPGGNTRENPSGGVLQNTRYGGKDGYYFFMGTSMAAPHIAGVAALVVAQGVSDPDAVRAVLQATARTPAGMTDRPADYAAHYGAGIVDAQAAVRKAELGYGGFDFAAAGLLGLGTLVLLRRRKLLGAFGGGGLLGLVIGASGLFFLGQLGAGSAPGASILAHGFPAWDAALFGAAGHGNPLFYSALVPVGLTVLFYGVPRARGFLAGFALGVAGHLAAHAFAPTVGIHFVPAALTGLWLGMNALIAAGCGFLVARR